MRKGGRGKRLWAAPAAEACIRVELLRESTPDASRANVQRQRHNIWKREHGK